MPEIAEISRIVNFLKKHAVGKTIAAVKTQEDDIVYGKVGTSATAFRKAMSGKKIVDARQQGKYFWLVMDSPPHPLMHFGMAGWMKFKNDETAYYKPTKPEAAEWPPKSWKFLLQLKEDPECEVAFVDKRRLGRIRLIDAKAEDMRKTSPLKENGPDPVLDKDILTVEWLGKKLRSKRVPVKALLLDQANISGIGNWVGDEVMYQARLHPEQYSNTFNDEQVKRLHEAIMYVCDTAVEVNAESDRFPKDWLMLHRWSKGKKESKLPNGAKITFLTVGGRTSAIVPSVQKKTAAVAGDASEGAEDEDDEEEADAKPKKGGRKVITIEKEVELLKVDAPAKPKRGRKKEEIKQEAEEEPEEEKPRASKKQKLVTDAAAKRGKKTQTTDVKSEDTSGRRRSGRLAK